MSRCRRTGGAAQALDRDPGRFRPRAVRRLGADGRGAERHRTHHGGGRYRRAGERARELHRLRAHHVGLAAPAHRLALRALAEQRKRYGAPANWNCRDLKIFVNRVGFDQLGPERAKALNAVDTRLKLPTDQVDAVIAAGHDALRINPTFRDFLKGMGGRPRGAEPTEPAEPPSTPGGGRAGQPVKLLRGSAVTRRPLSAMPTAPGRALQAVLLDDRSRCRRGEELLQRPGFGLRLGCGGHAA